MTQKMDGYRGVWYQNQALPGPYRFKYSGGLGTYCAKHQPFAVHAPDVGRTFFCYGGVPAGYHEAFALDAAHLDHADVPGALHHCIAYYDHRTGTVPRPTVLLDKRTHDAHDNPVLALDDAGHIWVFSTAHGSLRPAYVHRSVRPYDIDAFVRVEPYTIKEGRREPVTNFAYMQAWHVPGRGFVYFYTRYAEWRRYTCFATSSDGVAWAWQELARIGEGHYQISTADTHAAATAFNAHPTAFRGDPEKRGLNWRTNLYYMQTTDCGETWQAADGTPLTLPLTETDNPALVHDYEAEGLLVYLKDIRFDADGHPLILFLTARGYTLGPENDPRTWRLARWDGNAWVISDITTSDNNYDMGSLYVEVNDALRVIAPTAPGPQAWNPGGEVVAWRSTDRGATWTRDGALTADSMYNHTYVRRPVRAHEGFYAFWADGHGRQPSASRLYFCTRGGEVYRLPEHMDAPTASPTLVPRTP